MAVEPGEYMERAQLHRELWHRAVEGINESVFWAAPAPKANSMAFLLLHLSDLRHFAARQLGLDLKAPWAEVLRDAQTADELPKDFRPELSEVVAHLDANSVELVNALEGIDEARLSATAPLEFPIEDPSLGGVLSFVLDHEESLIHQLAQLRTFFHLPPMDFEV